MADTRSLEEKKPHINVKKISDTVMTSLEPLIGLSKAQEVANEFKKHLADIEPTIKKDDLNETLRFLMNIIDSITIQLLIQKLMGTADELNQIARSIQLEKDLNQASDDKAAKNAATEQTSRFLEALNALFLAPLPRSRKIRQYHNQINAYLKGMEKILEKENIEDAFSTFFYATQHVYIAAQVNISEALHKNISISHSHALSPWDSDFDDEENNSKDMRKLSESIAYMKIFDKKAAPAPSSEKLTIDSPATMFQPKPGVIDPPGKNLQNQTRLGNGS